MKKKIYFFLMAAFLVTSSVFAADLTSGLRLHYTFDELVDGAFADASGNGWTGTAVGTPSLVTGYSGNAVSLTDADNYVSLNTGIVSDVTDFTFACWVNFNSFNDYGRILDFGSSTEVNTFFNVYSSGLLEFDIKKDEDTGEQQLTTSSAISTGEWTHLAVTGEYVDGVGTVKIYVNGVLSVTSTAFTSTCADMGSTTANYIGKSQYSADPTPDASFDEFRIYTRALDQEEVMVLNGYSEALIDAYNTLSLGTTTDITTNLTLPSTVGTGGVTVTWETSDSTVITNTGVITRGQYYRTAATLTATLQHISGTDTLIVYKTFDVVVYPINDPADILAVFDFSDASIHRADDGTVTVDDESGNGYVGTCVDGADIVKIGDTETFNVLSLGDGGDDYFDFGTEIGEAIYGLTDYTVSIFFRRDTTDGTTDWTVYGQPLYGFSNSLDQATDANGAMYYEPIRARHVCTPDNYDSEGSNYTGVGEGTPIGTWHSVVYSQISNAGALYFDGVQVATGTMPNPAIALKKSGLTGTLYNSIGRPFYDGDSYLVNTLVYGFHLYSVGLSADDMEDKLAIQSTITALDNAYASTTYDLYDYQELLNLLAEAHTAAATNYVPGLTALNAAIATAQADSASKTPSEAGNLALEEAIALYNELSAPWIELGELLASLEDEIALGYPGLADFQTAIATAQTAYNDYNVTDVTVTTLEEAVATYLKTQPASGANPLDYTWMITNASFEENASGGTLDPDSYRDGSESGNGSYTYPNGWTVYLNHAGWCNSVYYTTNPSDGTYAFETWAATVNEFKVYQTINLKAGYYVLSAQMRTDASTLYDQHIYCKTAEGATYNSNSINDTVVVSYNALENWQTLYTLIHTDGGNAEVGFNATGFMQFDNMRLAYYGEDVPDTTGFTSTILNAGFEEGVNTTEGEGVDEASVIDYALVEGVEDFYANGDYYAPVSWTAYCDLDTANLGWVNMVSTTGNASEGTKLYEMWSPAVNSFKITQAIEAPATGYYRLTADFRCDESAPSKTDALHFDAHLFAKVGNFAQLESAKFYEGDTSYVWNDWNSLNAWQTLTLDFQASVGETITLGAASTSFMQMDNFTLTCNAIPGDCYSVGNQKVTKPASNYKVYTNNGTITISGLTNERVSLFDIAGRQIKVTNPAEITVNQGLYFVKINNEVTKVLVK